MPPFNDLADPAIVASLPNEAEDAGWHGFFIWDHVRWREPVAEVADAWITLAAIATSTPARRTLSAFISDCTTFDQVRDVAQTGVARLPWKLVGASGEQDLASSGLTVRCLQLSDGSLPETDDDAGVLAYIARAY